MSLADALAVAKAQLQGGYFGPRTTTKVVNDHQRNEPDALTLIGQAGSTADAYSLARVVAAECGTLPTTYGYAICEGVLNECKAAGVSVLTKVTTPGVAYPNANKGYYGEQRTRWCATSKDPLKWHHAVALAVISNPNVRITSGARRWISCNSQDAGMQNGKPLPTDAMGIVKSWATEGWAWIGPVFDELTGVELLDPYLQCMFHQVGKGNVDTQPALDMIAERRGSKFVAHVDTEHGSRHDDGEGLGGVLLAGGAAAAALRW
jgi:hypothetical protein